MPRFDDMRLRVINSAPCYIWYRFEKPNCLPYGVLTFSYDADDAFATFGDLTIQITAVEMIKLAKLTGHKAGDEWQCPQCSV